MSPRIGRILPPAAAPIRLRDIAAGLVASRAGAASTAAFADQLREHFQVSHCFLLSSGKAALALLLQALRDMHPDRDEVLIPAFTCYSVPAAIHRVGLKIRVCDIEPDTLDFDCRELARQLPSPRLLCVIPTHLFGVTADVPRVRELIRGRGVAIVEDAAQTMGGQWQSRKTGTLGDVGFFSLERGKAFSTVRGGIIVTDADDIAGALERRLEAVPETALSRQTALALYALVLAVFSRPALYWIPRAMPFLGLGETIFDPDFPIRRLSSFQTGMARGWQDRLEASRQQRAANAALLRRLGVKACCPGTTLVSGPLRYPVLAADEAEKKAVLECSDRLGLGAADVYPATVDTIPGLKGTLVGGSSEKARSLMRRMFTLPVHPQVTLADLEKIADLFDRRKTCSAIGRTIEHKGGGNR